MFIFYTSDNDGKQPYAIMDHDKYWRCLENVFVTDLQLSSTFINYNINIDDEVETNQSLHVSFEI